MVSGRIRLLCWGLAGVMCVLVPGCGPAQPRSQGDETPATASARLPAKATMTLDQLAPAPAATTQAAGGGELIAQAEAEVAEGEKLLAKREYARAIRRLERAASLAPGNARVHRALGLAYVGLRNPGKALENLRIAAASVPDDPEVHLLLGRLCAAQKLSGEAIDAYRAAINAPSSRPDDPLTAEALWRLAQTLSREGYWTAALECYNRLAGWIDLHGRRYVSRSALKGIVYQPELLLTEKGRLLLRLNRPAEAAGPLERAYRINRTGRTTARLLIEALSAAGQYDRAEALLVDFSTEPAQSGQVPGLAYLAAGSRARRGQPAEALRMLARLTNAVPEMSYSIARGVRQIDATSPPADFVSRFAAKIRPGEPSQTAALYFVAGRLAHARRDENLAVALYEKSIAARQDFLPAYEGLVDVHLQRNRQELIDRLLERVEQLAGETDFACYLSGKVNLSRRKTARAVADLQKALVRNRRHVPALVLLGRAYARAKMPDEAINSLRKAATLNPADASIQHRLFSLYVANRRFQDAEKVADKIITRCGDSVAGRIMKIKLLLVTGRRDRAVRLLKDLQTDAPDDIDVKLLAIRAQVHAEDGKLNPKDLEAAVERLSEIIRDDPHNAEAMRMLEAILRSSAKPSEASKTWRALYERTSRDTRVARFFAASLFRLRVWDEAADVLEGVLADRTGNLTAQRMLLKVLAELKQPDRARRHLEKWRKEAPSAGRARSEWYNAKLLEMYRVAKDYGKAHKLIDSWMGEVRDNPQRIRELRAERMRLLEETEQYDRMQAELDKWIDEAGGKYARGYRALKIRFYGKAGRLDDAETYARSWIRISPDALVPRAALISALTEARAYDKAIGLLDGWLEDFTRGAATTQPVDVTDEIRWVWNESLALLQRAGKHAEALKRVSGYIRVTPRNIPLLNAKSTILFELNRSDEAISVLEGAYRLDPDDPGAGNNLGYYYAERGIKLDEAERMIRKALAATSSEKRGNIAFQDSLAWVFYKQGRFAAAGRLFGHVLEQLDAERAYDWTHAVILDHAGDAFCRLGQKDEAVRRWSQAVEMARKAKYPDAETRRVLERSAGKVDAVKAGRQPVLAPLGEGVKVEKSK